MNLADLKTYVFNRLHATEADGPWSGPEITEYLNDAMFLIAALITQKAKRFFQREQSINEIADQAEYLLVANVAQVIKVERRIGRDGSAMTTPMRVRTLSLSPVAEDAFAAAENQMFLSPADWMLGESYQLIGLRKIKLYPASQTTQADSIRMRYAYRPDKMIVESDVPFMDAGTTSANTTIEYNLESFHPFLADIAAAKACVRTEEWQKQQALRADGMEGVQLLVQQLSRNWVQESQAVQLEEADLYEL